VNQIYALSFVNPYWTIDGVAAGIDVYRRNVDTSSTALSAYQTKSTGAGVNFGVPITEYDSIRLGLTFENTELTIDPFLAPPRYIDFVNQFGEVTDTLRTTIGYTRDSRDSITYPTRGWLTDIMFEVGVPPGDLLYYRASLRQQYFYTHERLPWLTFMLNGELGYADGYNDKPLPFFKNFYAGGVGSVRGFESNSLGPIDAYGNVLGGRRKIVGNVELFYPLFKGDKSVRGSVFVDVGQIWAYSNLPDYPGETSAGVLLPPITSCAGGPSYDPDVVYPGAQDFRYSAGVGLAWNSPIGPLKFSYAFPINDKCFDRVQQFQFQVGNVF
jgi:outer membrane protein insertion porin family